MRLIKHWRMLGIFSVLLVQGCASPGAPHQPMSLISPQALGLQASTGELISSDWWAALGSPVLDEMIAKALNGNPSLATVSSRIERMAAIADLSRSSTAPQVMGSAEISRQRYSENGLFPPPIAGGAFTITNAQVGVSWSPDLYGQRTAEIALSLSQLQAAKADMAAAALSLSTQIARGFITLAKLCSERDVMASLLEQREQALSLIEQRFKAGLDTQLDLQQNKIAVSDAKNQLESLDNQLVLVRHQLAVLTGQGPQSYESLSVSLEQLKLDGIPTRLGADLLGRRADVTAAKWRVQAAAQDIKVAQAQFYPDVSLSAFVGLSSIGLDKMLDLGSRQGGVGPAVRLPIFDGGRLKAQLQGRQSDLDISISAYNQTVLEAVKEVSDALSTSQSVVKLTQEQDRALNDAQEAYQINLQRFEAGVQSKMAVLNAKTQVLSQTYAALELKARALDNRAVLAKALGGGWHE